MKIKTNNIFDELYTLPFAENVTLIFGNDEPLAVIKTTDYGEVEFPLIMVKDKSYIQYYNSVIGERSFALREYYSGISATFKQAKL